MKKNRKKCKFFESSTSVSEVVKSSGSVAKSVLSSLFKQYSSELVKVHGDEDIKKGLIIFNNTFSKYVLDALADDSVVSESSTITLDLVKKISVKLSSLMSKVSSDEWEISLYLYLSPDESIKKISQKVTDESKRKNLSDYLLKVVASDEKALKTVILNFFKLITYNKKFSKTVISILESYKSTSEFISKVSKEAGTKLYEGVGLGTGFGFGGTLASITGIITMFIGCKTSITCYLLGYFMMIAISFTNFFIFKYVFKILFFPIKYIISFLKKLANKITGSSSSEYDDSQYNYSSSDLEQGDIKQFYESMNRLNRYLMLYYYIS